MMDAEIQKDIEFALLVNESVKSDPATYSGVISRNEPYRQFILETQMLATISPADWFNPDDPIRAPWQTVIRADRLRYEKVAEEKTVQAAAHNAVQEELARLKTQVDHLLAELQKPEETPTEEPESEPEPAVEPDAEPENEESNEDSEDEE